MEVNRINNKEQILKNLQELDTKLENRQISRKEYKSIKKQYQDQLESVEVIERIRRMQGNTTPYSPETIHEYNSTETTKAHDKEILQKYINKPQPKTEILEQSQKDREEDKSLLNKYLKPEGEEVSEEKINRPKLNTPEDKALIKKFITDPTSKKEINSEKDTKEEPIINTKLKYVKSNKKSSNTSEDGANEAKTTNDKKESIRSIISSFGNKTKSKEPPKEQEPIEKTQIINEPEPIKEIKEELSEVKPIKNTDDVIEEKSTKDVETINEEVKSEPFGETKSDIETETENTTQTSSESNDKKERPKLKESIIVNSEDILKPKKDKESIPINEVSSLLDSSSPKPKPKESINLSSKDVSDAISYAMGESTSIVNVENINENDVNEEHVEELKVSENQVSLDDTKESGIKSFFGFKVGQYANESEEKVDNSKSLEINQNTLSEDDVNSNKSVFSDNVNDSILTTKHEENKTQSSKKDTDEKTKNNGIQSSQTKDKLVNNSESTDSEEKTQTKTISSVKPVFAVKGKDKLLNSENLQTEDKSKLALTKSISDFKKDKKSKSKNVENKSKNTKDNISSQTIYPTNQNQEKSESKSSKDSIKKPSTDDADERQKIIIGGILLGIILLILAVFGFNAYTSPENTKLYIDDTALAPNDTALTSNDTLNETATPSSTTTSVTKSTTASATATATYTSTSLNKSKITNNIYKNNPFRNNYGYKYGYRYKYKYRNHTNPKPNHNGSDDPDSEDPSSDGPFDNLSTK